MTESNRPRQHALVDRYSALELKLRSVQEAMELLLTWRAIGGCCCSRAPSWC